jgi:antibiotic biosynthesis monooxygenase (ABM) superfamily enzyme
MDPSIQVTAVITHRVRPGREAGYEEWIKGIGTDARSFNGYLGAHILRPELGVSADHVIVVQFDTCEHLQAWMQSQTRQGWIERVKPLIREEESVKVLTGLEPWFQLPGQSPIAAPKRYKQAILVWIGVASISLLVSPHVNALLASWPEILRVLVNMGITVALLTYWVMPFLTRYCKGWLFAK